jgi:hypothetical protein
MNANSFFDPAMFMFQAISFGSEVDFTNGTSRRQKPPSKRRKTTGFDLGRYHQRLNIWPNPPVERSSPLHLLSLPAEIRHRIYDFLIIGDSSANLVWEHWRMKGRKSWPLWNLIWTSRQLRDEGFYYYYGKMKFTASVTDLQNKTYLPWVNQIGDPGCSALRRLEFETTIKISRYQYEEVEGVRVQRVLEVFRIFYLLGVQLLHEEPYCIVQPTNISVQRSVKVKSSDPSEKIQDRLTFLCDSVVQFYVNQRKQELENVLHGIFRNTPLGTLGQKEITLLLELAAERFGISLNSNHQDLLTTTQEVRQDLFAMIPEPSFDLDLPFTIPTVSVFRSISSTTERLMPLYDKQYPFHRGSLPIYNTIDPHDYVCSPFMFFPSDFEIK